MTGPCLALPIALPSWCPTVLFATFLSYKAGSAISLCRIILGCWWSAEVVPPNCSELLRFVTCYCTVCLLCDFFLFSLLAEDDAVAILGLRVCRQNIKYPFSSRISRPQSCRAGVPSSAGRRSFRHIRTCLHTTAPFLVGAVCVAFSLLLMFALLVFTTRTTKLFHYFQICFPWPFYLLVISSP